MTITTFTSNSGGTGGCEATTLKSDVPTSNHNTDGYVEAFKWVVDGSDSGNALVRFTGVAATIPAGSTINSVKIRLRGAFYSGDLPTYFVGAYRSLRPWVAAQATWNEYSTDDSWTNPGGLGSGDSAVPPARSASLYLNDVVDGTWYEWTTTAGLVADVQAAVDASAEPSWIFVREDDYGAQTRAFYSDEAADGYRPELVVDWTAEVSVQTSAPSSDVAAGSWSPNTGTSLYSVLDESAADDSDYISTNTFGAQCVVGLQALTDPGVSTGHIVRYRARGDGLAGIQIDLMQGGTVIATWTHDPAPDSLTTFEQTLSAGQADSITDYSNLRLRFTEV